MQELRIHDAVKIARDTLAREHGHSVILVEDATMEREFGWVFFPRGRQHAATHDPNHAIPGIGPLVVLRENGKTVWLSTSAHPAAVIADFERLWRQRP